MSYIQIISGLVNHDYNLLDLLQKPTAITLIIE